MKRIIASVGLIVAVAVFVGAQPITTGGLQKVVHTNAFTGSGTNPSPLDLTHACSDGQALTWSAGSAAWACSTPNPISGLTTNHVVKAASSTSITNGNAIDDGSTFVLTEPLTNSCTITDSSGTNLNGAIYGHLTSTTYADPPFSGTNPPIFAGVLGQSVAPGSITCTGVSCGESTPISCGVRGTKSTPTTGWNNIPNAEYGACLDDTAVNGYLYASTSVKTPLVTTNNTSLDIHPSGFNGTNIGSAGQTVTVAGTTFTVDSSGNMVVAGTFESTGIATFDDEVDVLSTKTIFTDHIQAWVNSTLEINPGTGAGKGVRIGDGVTNGFTWDGTTATLPSGVDMASHKITNLTDGSNPSDAATFGQLATSIGGAISGTLNKTAKFTASNIVGDGWASDDGTTWGVASKFTITEATGNTRTFGDFQADGNLSTLGSSARVGPTSGTSDTNLNIGRDVTSATNAENGYRITAYSDGDIYLDSKTSSGGSTHYRVGSGTGHGYDTTWLTVTNGTGAANIGTPFTASSTAHIVGNATLDGNVILAQSADTYVYDSLATSSGNQGLTINAAGTGKIIFQSGHGGFTNAGTGGIELDAGGSGTSSVWSVTNGGTSVQIGGATMGSAGVTIASQGGTNDLPSVLSYHGDPNGNVTSNEGSLCMDGLNNTIWINTNSASAWSQLTTTSTIATTYTGLGMFGDGNQGSITWNSGTTTLTKDIYATDITCNSGAVVITAGYIIYDKGAFTGPASGTCTIKNDGANGSSGTLGVGNAVGGTGAAANAVLPGGKNGGGGAFGGNGSTGATPIFPADYQAGCGGSGGGDGTHSGGTCTVSAFAATNGSINSLFHVFNGQWRNGAGGNSGISGGGGGGGGGGTAVGTGIGGGGGGGGGFVVVVASKFVNPSNITIQANGGNGANGVVSGGSAGGGGGGGGGYVWAVCASGTAPTLQATGGTHGNGAGASGVNGSDGNAGKTNSGYCPLATSLLGVIDLHDPRALGALAMLYLLGMIGIKRMARSANDNESTRRAA